MNAYINTPIRVLLQLRSGVNYLEALRSVHSSADGFGSPFFYDANHMFNFPFFEEYMRPTRL